MSPTFTSRLASWLKGPRRTTPTALEPSAEEEPLPAKDINLTNPVENYYKQKASLSVPFFYRFALQTQSLKIRDMFAKVASSETLDLQDLLSAIEQELSQPCSNHSKESLTEIFDSEMLLALADLLANTARDAWDTHHAVLIYDFVWQLFGDEAFSERNKLQYVEALHELGDYSQAAGLAESFNINGLAPCQVELLNLQRIRKTAETPQYWLLALNQLYKDLGMAPVRLLDDDSLPLLDRLSAESGEKVEGPKITVIMPTFSPGSGIRTAIRGLLEQSWQNLEIIVVDDASPAKFVNLFQEIEQLDPRIHVVHQKENAGAYVARNMGLKLATGDFITTHDDDDWSHPNKLAIQVKKLLDNPQAVATTSAHIRASPELYFYRLNIQAQYMQLNYSSLMFRRSVVDEIGPWDTVNRGGDSEFLTRLEEYYGSDRVLNLLTRPLSFSRVWSGSLTSGEMARGYFAYSRLLYRWAFRQWHWSSSKAEKKAIRTEGDTRPYAIPTSFEPGQRSANLGLFDVIYVSDFFRQAKYVNRALQEIRTLSEAGLRVGYMHLYSPETTIPAGIPPELFELQTAGKVTQVSHDDEAETKLLVVNDPAIGMFLDQLRSTVRPRRSILIDHQLATLSGGEPRTPTVTSQAMRNLDNFFNSRFEVTGGTEEDYKRIQSLYPRKRLLPPDSVWHTHIGTEPAEISPPKRYPVVGFHSYGNIYRWPNNTEAFREIFNPTNYTCRLLGNLKQPIEKFGARSFRGIELFHPDDTGEATFLEGLDFWVYYPHYRLQDQIWEPVLSAMQAGKVVIMPPRLRTIYGDAAVYAHRDGIVQLVSDYTRDLDAYKTQAERGQQVVASTFSAEQLHYRIKELLDKRVDNTV